jgi:hypothetical protein
MQNKVKKCKLIIKLQTPHKKVTKINKVNTVPIETGLEDG